MTGIPNRDRRKRGYTRISCVRATISPNSIAVELSLPCACSAVRLLCSVHCFTVPCLSVSECKHVVFAQVLVDGPSALGAGLDDEYIAGLERNGRLALDLDGAASREQMAVFPGIVVDLPDAGRRLPNAGEDFAVVGGMQIPSFGMRIAADRGPWPGRIRLHGGSQIA